MGNNASAPSTDGWTEEEKAHGHSHAGGGHGHSHGGAAPAPASWSAEERAHGHSHAGGHAHGAAAPAPAGWTAEEVAHGHSHAGGHAHGAAAPAPAGWSAEEVAHGHSHAGGHGHSHGAAGHAHAAHGYSSSTARMKSAVLNNGTTVVWLTAHLSGADGNELDVFIKHKSGVPVPIPADALVATVDGLPTGPLRVELEPAPLEERPVGESAGRCSHFVGAAGAMPRDAGPLTVRLALELGGAVHEVVWENFVPLEYAHHVD